MAQTVHVALGQRSYDIDIDRALRLRPAWPNARRALLVSDTHVAPLHGDAVQAALVATGLEVARAIVPAGEGSKSLTQLAALYDAAATARLDRSALAVALGGGMVGDLCGFFAATWLRGIRYLQIPTSLLAMVDSAVGGKTGVNLSHGKNLVGVFHQPVAVAADLSVLRTLPPREYRSGLAEVVKYGVIRDAALFDRLEANAEAAAAADPDFLEPIVARCCTIKADVVSTDETETGPRAILNFGHTYGHAVEKAAGYQGLLHGEAVAIGMAYAAELSVRRGMPAEDRDRLVSLLRRLDLPVRLPPGVKWDELHRAMAVDKKTAHGRPRFVLADRIGAVRFGCEVGDEDLLAAHDACASAPATGG